MIVGYTLLPCVSYYLWSAHTKMVYTNANTSRHSMSLDYMLSIAKTRNADSTKNIIHDFMASWFNWNASYEWLYWAGGLIILLCIYIGKKDVKEQKNTNKKFIFQIVVVMVVEYFVYKVNAVFVRSEII